MSGVYAGDPMRLTTRYALPKLYNLEQTYGSFIKGSIAKAKMPKSDRERLATKQIFSVEGGLENLVRALADGIGRERIVLSATMMIAQVCNLGLGEFVHTIGDAHIYLNHLDQVNLQLTRTPKKLPKMKLNPEVKSIFDFKYEDFTLEDYDPYPLIRGKVAV